MPKTTRMERTSVRPAARTWRYLLLGGLLLCVLLPPAEARSRTVAGYQVLLPLVAAPYSNRIAVAETPSGPRGSIPSTPIHILGINDGSDLVFPRLFFWQANPTWSPDGQELAFTSSEGCCEDGIFRSAPDGSHRILVYPLSGHPLAGLTWSPTGQHFAFSDGGNVTRITRDGMQTTRLFTASIDLDHVSQRLEDAAWSPTGDTIAITLGAAKPITQTAIWLLSLSGKPLLQVTALDWDAHDPAWSPDGQSLAFVAQSTLYVMRLGTTERKVIATRLNLASPTWAPDSHAIAYVADGICQPPPGGICGGRLWITTLATGETRMIPTDYGVDEAAWSPR